MSELSHLDSDGRARMVDVGHKAVTSRSATASGRFVTTAEVIGLVRAEGMPKADVLATARIAGIQGAKKTSELIPLCHPLPLSSVKVEFAFDGESILVTATAKTTGQTGVEMEALTAVAVAGLTLHDMVKAVDPFASMTDVRLETKTGGKSGQWARAGVSPVVEPVLNTAVVIVASTRAAAGEYADTTGPVIAAWLEERHYSTQTEVVADAEIASAMSAAVAAHPAIIITTGGTGISPTDRTPEATAAVLTQELPGIAEAIRAAGLAKTPTAALSRGLAGLAGGTIVVNLPGSSGGVKDGLAVLDELLDHLVGQLAGGTHD